jgi:hypothetical protein
MKKSDALFIMVAYLILGIVIGAVWAVKINLRFSVALW